MTDRADEPDPRPEMVLALYEALLSMDAAKVQALEQGGPQERPRPAGTSGPQHQGRDPGPGPRRHQCRR